MANVHGLWGELLEATERKGGKLQEAGAQQHFNRNLEDLEIWASEVEAQLGSDDYGKDLISVNFLVTK